MDRLEKVFGLKKVRNAIKRLVVDENRTQQGLLGLDIVRRRPERGFRGRLLACNRIDWCHGPDQEIRVWLILDYSTSRITQRQRHSLVPTRRTQPRGSVVSRLTRQWEIIFAAFPTTHRRPQHDLVRPLTGDFRQIAGRNYSPARRSGVR